jgi:hypothetical protein
MKHIQFAGHTCCGYCSSDLMIGCRIEGCFKFASDIVIPINLMTRQVDPHERSKYYRIW